MKKILSITAALAMALILLAGCGGTDQPTDSGTGDSADSFDATREIAVVSREDGSGTRGAFIELFGIETKNDAGEKIDNTTVEAIVTNSTSVMMTTVAGNPYAIGYISLGSLNDTVKALQIDGVDATADNIKAGTYSVSRPFNIATKGDVSAAAQDFIHYVLSAEGQAVVAQAGYIALDGAEPYTASGASGKVVLAGSSSVTPVMEKLKEAYVVLNPAVEIQIQESDSSTGMTAAIDGICDIGMASRELKDSELSAGLTPTVIALDGIAVVVNNGCPLSGLDSETVRAIFTGEILLWDEALAASGN